MQAPIAITQTSKKLPSGLCESLYSGQVTFGVLPLGQTWLRGGGDT